MAEFIKREAVIDLITRRYENPEICTQEINSIPAADVAPVVRCKDCAHRGWVQEPCEDMNGEGARQDFYVPVCPICGSEEIDEFEREDE